MHVTVISYTAQLDPGFEEVALRAVDGPGRRFLRAQRPSELVYALAAIRQPIVRLDLYGHGAPGRLRLGDEVLVDADAAASGWLQGARASLAQAATLRLLGCETALGARGTRLLQTLADILDVEVQGATGDLLPADFGPGGLLEETALRLLISARPTARSAAPARSSSCPGAAG